MGFWRRKIAQVEADAIVEPEPAPEPAPEPEPVPVVKGTHKWRFFLESPDGKEFRRTTIAAETEHFARDVIVRRELEKCAYRLDPRNLESASKGQIATHEQLEPYRIVKVEEA